MSQKDNISPAEIRQHQFATGWRGLVKTEVMNFLDEVADAFAALQGDNLSLRADLDRQQLELSEFKKREQLLKDTLINAQQVIEAMKANAQKEGEIIIHEAELKADKILQEAFTRQAKIRSDIEELKRVKTTFAAQMRGILESHQRLLAESEASA
jgi:cell division initiation protein